MGLKLGDVSPAAALMGAEGAIRDVASTGALGVIPKMMTKDDKRKKQKPGSDGSAGTSVQAMKKGGKVRGCGCAKRGVRKCKMY
jgi:hypothetical protein